MYRQAAEETADISVSLDKEKHLLPEEILKILCSEERRGKARQEIQQWNKKGIGLVDIDNPRYPGALKPIYEAPLVLFYKGEIPKDWQRCPCVGIVGTRRPDHSGLEIAKHFGSSCANAGFCVVSGIAMGIDAAAHEGALDSVLDFPTIAVLGAGVDTVYPTVNASLYKRILDRGGLLLSQFEPGTKPFPANFLNRNRIIAGLSRSVIVIQASLKSGSLVTARYAMEEGREVMVLPGNVNNPHYEGSNALIRDGAHLVRNIDDVCEVFGLDVEHGVKAGNAPRVPFSVAQQKIIDTLRQAESVNYDVLSQSFCNPSAFAHEVLQLELLDIISRKPGNFLALKQEYRDLNKREE